MRACVRARMRACMRACLHARVRACVRACMRACVHACVGVCVCTCVCACVRVYVRGPKPRAAGPHPSSRHRSETTRPSSGPTSSPSHASRHTWAIDASILVLALPSSPSTEKRLNVLSLTHHDIFVMHDNISGITLNVHILSDVLLALP